MVLLLTNLEKLFWLKTRELVAVVLVGVCHNKQQATRGLHAGEPSHEVGVCRECGIAFLVDRPVASSRTA